MKFTKDQISDIEKFILVEGSQHTMRALIKQFATNEKQERQIDKIMQRLRKAGKVEMVRSGRAIGWKPTVRHASVTEQRAHAS